MSPKEHLGHININYPISWWGQQNTHQHSRKQQVPPRCPSSYFPIFPWLFVIFCGDPPVNQHRPCQVGVGRWVSMQRKYMWFSGSNLSKCWWILIKYLILNILVGGLEHQFYFPINIGNVIIPIDELIFFRGVAKNHQPAKDWRNQPVGQILSWSNPFGWHVITWYHWMAHVTPAMNRHWFMAVVTNGGIFVEKSASRVERTCHRTEFSIWNDPLIVGGTPSYCLCT